MTLPNFLVIGAPKAGTTSLYYYLKQHPQIFMPRKEPDFFALEGEKLEYPGPDETFKIQKQTTHIDSYRHLFNSVTNEIAIGEVSPIYLYTEKAPLRIKHYIPETKLIAILRDPVERAFSHYLYWASQGWESETDFDFARAIKEEPSRIQNGWHANWHYVNIGFYYQQLQRYFNLFKHERIKIYLYEDLLNDEQTVLRDIFEFLEVNIDFMPNLSKTHNKTKVPKSRTLNFFLNRPNLIKSMIKPLIPVNLRKSWGDRVKQSNLGKPNLSADIRKQLIQVYREDILQLQALIGRDLAKWLQ